MLLDKKRVLGNLTFLQILHQKETKSKKFLFYQLAKSYIFERIIPFYCLKTTPSLAEKAPFTPEAEDEGSKKQRIFIPEEGKYPVATKRQKD